MLHDPPLQTLPASRARRMGTAEETPVTKPDVFAFKNSGLENFLFAEIGLESNGSYLTILSLLARLDVDPWAKAAEWADAPRAKVVDLLAEDIARTPLAPDTIATARATAARLACLLPRRSLGNQADPKGHVKSAQVALMVLVACSLAASVALSLAAQLR